MLQEPDAKAERGFKWVAVVALIEAMVLSLVGGLIGVFFGWGAARLMGQIQYSGLTITPVVGLDSILLATLFSMAIGLFFGIYPATRAARLQPVEALRYE
jgi:putative ABC transport system permease protein